MDLLWITFAAVVIIMVKIPSEIGGAMINLTPESANLPKAAFAPRLNFFDIELLRYAAESRTGNLMISPASIKSTLAMLLEGAREDTADEVRRALRLPEGLQDFRDQLNGYLGTLKVKTPSVTLENANRIFLSDKLNPLKGYEKMLKEVYLSEIQKVNFSNPESAAQSINGWVKNYTNGLIPSLVEPIDIETDSSLMVANALYFKSVWENSFDVNQTVIRCFETPKGCQKAYMMENQGEFNYGQIDDIRSQALELPYKDGKFSMIILLPNEKHDVSLLIRDLPYMSLPQILSQMDPTDVQISLPRFTVNTNEDLVPILQNVGIKKIFTNAANLKGIIEGGVNPSVNNVFHKTHIEVNEMGSIAAAATGAMVIPLMGSTVARLNADHPFLFFIRDIKTGAVLFEGRIVEPELVPVAADQPGIPPVDFEEILNSMKENSPKTEVPKNQPIAEAPKPAVIEQVALGTGDRFSQDVNTYGAQKQVTVKP